MTDLIKAGSILVEDGISLPNSLRFQSDPQSNGWTALTEPRSTFEKSIQEAGWTFFFMAGQIKATVFGFGRQDALRAALKQLIADTRSQHCNSIEITQVTDNSFLRVPYVSVSAHPRHLQKSTLFPNPRAGSGPASFSRTQSQSS